MRGTTNRIPGLVLTDHNFEIPLDHAKPDGAKITVYGREVVAPEREHDDLPWIVFLQGGPGYGSPRPMARNGWLGVALEDHRVFLLDQRGTARSTPATAQTLASLESPRAQADYLKHFRADSIVRDCEHIRKELVGPDRPWSVLGQSYGGFCATTYLSIAPEGLDTVYITGGIPPVGVPVDEIYRNTYAILRMKNERYFERYPEDAGQIRRILEYLDSNEVRLPEGDVLTPRKFQLLGLHFGMSDGFELIHYPIEEAFTQDGELSHIFLHGFEHILAYNTNPIFALLHEAAYAEGFATNWSAERVRAEFPEFDPARRDGPPFFTGEMIYPWMLEEFGRLRPLREAGELLASDDDWGPLYDVERLRRNEVPTFAAVYYDDMYIARELSLRTAENFAGLRMWITNEHEHNGLRAHGDAVFGRLRAMAKGDA